MKRNFEATFGGSRARYMGEGLNQDKRGFGLQYVLAQTESWSFLLPASR